MKTFIGRFVKSLHQWILLGVSIVSIGLVIAIESHLFSELHIDEKTIGLITLTLLSLLAIFTIVDVFIDRNKTELVLESISKSFITASGYISNKSSLPPISERLKSCNELWISGATLHGLLSNEQVREVFKSFIAKGKTLRILLYKKDHELESHILKLWPPDKQLNDSREVYRGEQTLSYEYIKMILEDCFKKDKNSVAKVSVHALNTFLPHSLVIFDPKENDTCVVQVQIDLMGCNSSNGFPVFQLNTIADEKHKKLFIDEFNFLCSPEQSNTLKYEFK